MSLQTFWKARRTQAKLMFDWRAGRSIGYTNHIWVLRWLQANGRYTYEVSANRNDRSLCSFNREQVQFIQETELTRIPGNAEVCPTCLVRMTHLRQAIKVTK